MLDDGGCANHHQRCAKLVAALVMTQAGPCRPSNDLSASGRSRPRTAVRSKHLRRRSLHHQQSSTDWTNTGTLARRRLHSLALCHAMSLASTSPICACSCAYSSARAKNSSRAKLGTLSSARMRSSSGSRCAILWRRQSRTQWRSRGWRSTAAIRLRIRRSRRPYQHQGRLLFGGLHRTKRIVGRLIASQSASASASFLPRFTYGLNQLSRA